MRNIFKGNSHKGGVYKITNTKNGRQYFGSCKCFKVRANQHLKSLQKGTHHNKYLQNDFNKCGEGAFEFHVVEVVEGDQDTRLLVEDGYVTKLYDNQKNCYNFQKEVKAKGRSCYSKTPEETKKKRSKAMKRAWKDPTYRKNQSKIQSKKTKEQWQNPEFRKAKIKGIKEFHDSEEGKKLAKKTSKRMATREVSKETRNKISKTVSKVNKELWQDPDYRNKVIKGRKRSWAKDKKRKEAASKLMVEMMQKTYVLKDPTGKIITITNMQEFCKNYPEKLIPNCMSKVARGLKESYKGWKSLKEFRPYKIKRDKENVKEYNRLYYLKQKTIKLTRSD